MMFLYELIQIPAVSHQSFLPGILNLKPDLVMNNVSSYGFIVEG